MSPHDHITLRTRKSLPLSSFNCVIEDSSTTAATNVKETVPRNSLCFLGRPLNSTALSLSSSSARITMSVGCHVTPKQPVLRISSGVKGMARSAENLSEVPRQGLMSEASDKRLSCNSRSGEHF